MTHIKRAGLRSALRLCFGCGSVCSLTFVSQCLTRKFCIVTCTAGIRLHRVPCWHLKDYKMIRDQYSLLKQMFQVQDLASVQPMCAQAAFTLSLGQRFLQCLKHSSDLTSSIVLAPQSVTWYRNSSKGDRKSTRLNSSLIQKPRMPSSA